MEMAYGTRLREMAERMAENTIPRDQTDSVIDFIRNGGMRHIGIVSGLS